MGAVLESGYLYEFGPFTANAAERTLSRDGQMVSLAPKAFDTLLVLAANPGRLLSKAELMDLVWPGTRVEAVNLAHNISDLRRILGAEAIQTVPKFGYRFALSVRKIDKPDNAPSPPVPVEPASANIAALAHRFKRFIPAACLAVAAAAGLLFSFTRIFRGAAAAPEPEIHSLAVLPFHSIGEPQDDPYLEFGLADALITRLGALRGLAVRPMGAVRRFASATQDPVEAGKQLKVEAVLDGAIQRQGKVLRISARLLDTNNGLALWTGTLDESVGTDALALEDALSARLLAALRPRISAGERDRFAGRPTASPQAFQLYVEGRYFFARRNVADFHKAVDRFEQAVTVDPNYSLAWVGLADARQFLAQSDQAVRPALERALALDPDLAEAHASLGLHQMNQRDWRGAESEYQRAIQLSPNLAVAHQWYGDYLGYMGRFAESSAELNRAVTLDPLSTIIWSDQCEMQVLASRFAQAIDTCRYVLEVDPQFLPVRDHLVQAYLLNHQPQEALRVALEFFHADGGAAATARLVEAYFASGDRARSRVLLSELEGSEKGRLAPVQVAASYCFLGEREKAIYWLKKAEESGAAELINIKMHPYVASLRSDPRVQAMLERLHMTGKTGSAGRSSYSPASLPSDGPILRVN